MNRLTKNVIGVVLALAVVVALCVLPLMLNKESEFGGADGAAGDVVLEIQEDFEPWAEPMWSPPGGETESLLFCVQAALGSGVFFFGVGYLAAMKKYKPKDAAK